MKNQALLKKLYLLCFTDDTVEDADFLFENVFSKAELLCEEVDGKPISMLFLMDCTLNQKGKETPFYYLYAACTHPDFRGKGIMGGLLEKAKAFAEKKDKAGIILKPASPSLFKFYNNYGFESLFKVAKANLTIEDLADTPKTNLFEIPLKDWSKKRQNILPRLSDAFICFPEKLLCAAAVGSKVVTDQKGSFIVYENRDGVLLCKECLTETNNSLGILSLAKTVMEKEGLNLLELRTPQAPFLKDNPLFEENFFSVCSNKGVIADNPYHGFAFD
jgi:GNAT superfamily N-acetyltransferase